MSKDCAIRILKEFEGDRIIHLEKRITQVLDLPGLENILLTG